jgi:hypothetical protein
VQRLTWAYLQTQLNPGSTAWQEAQQALLGAQEPLGRVESK